MIEAAFSWERNTNFEYLKTPLNSPNYFVFLPLRIAFRAPIYSARFP